MKQLFKTMFFSTLAILLFAAFRVVALIVAQANPSDSVAIIGGADGPTAIFLTQSLVLTNPLFWLVCVATILFVVSAIGWFVTRRK